MAFERIGLGGKLTFDEQPAVANMGKARDALGRFTKATTQSTTAQGPHTRGLAAGRDAMGRFLPQAQKATAAVNKFAASFTRAAGKVTAGAARMKQGFGQIGAGLKTATLAFAPFAAGIFKGIKTAGEFEKQMSAVGAITRSGEEDMKRLADEAKKQGILSAFSAKQSAEAMEFMGRAGFNTTQIISGLGGVMAAAAAEGIDLATSADIVARVVKGMGMEADDASHIADVLALTSAKTNTSIIALGESFKFGAPQAKAMGISVEETAAVFGKLADAGLRGSTGGTAFTNMLVKLSKPSKGATELMKKWNIQLTETDGSLKPLPKILDQFQKRIDKIPDTVERARVQTELFGIRGAKAYSALATAGSKALKQLTDDLLASSFGIGAAQEAANKRLDNFLGALTLFGSSVESVAIEFFGPFLNGFKELTQDVTGGLNAILFAVQGLKRIQQGFNTFSNKFAREETERLLERTKLTEGLGDRQAATSKAALATLTKEAVGNEKLTRQQRIDRNKSFAQFVEQNLAAQGLSKAARAAERERLADFVKRAEQGKLSTQDELKIRKQFLNSMVAQSAQGKKLSKEARAERVAAIESMVQEQAMRVRMDAEARALLEKEKELASIEQEHGRTAMLIAEGVMDAIETIKSGIQTVVERIKSFGKAMTNVIGEDRLKQFVKIGTIAVIVAGALVPLLAGLAFMGFLLKAVVGPLMGVVNVFLGLGKVLIGVAGLIKGTLAAAFWPITLVVGAAVLAFLAFRKEGESVGDTLGRAFQGVKTIVMTVWSSAIKPFIDGFMSAWDGLTDGLLATWSESFGRIKAFWDVTAANIRQVATSIFGFFSSSTSESSTDFASLGGTIANIVGGALTGLISIAEFAANAFMSVTNVVLTFWEGAIKPFLEGFKTAFSTNLQFVKDVWNETFAIVGVVFDSVMGTIKAVFGELFDEMSAGTSGQGTDWKNLGMTIGNILLAVTSAVGKFVGFLVGAFGGLVNFLVPILVMPFRTFWNSAKQIVGGVLDLFQGRFAQGLSRIFVGILDIITLPIRALMKGMIQLARTVPGATKLIGEDRLAKLEKFAKHGIAGEPTTVRRTVQIQTDAADNVIKLDERREKRRRQRLAEQALKIDAPTAQAPEGRGKISDIAAQLSQQGVSFKNLSEQVAVAKVIQERNLQVNKEGAMRAQAILRQSALMRQEERKARADAAKQKELKANVNIKDERTTNVNTCVQMDGREVAKGVAKHKQGIADRTGAKTPPFIRARAREDGAA